MGPAKRVPHTPKSRVESGAGAKRADMRDAWTRYRRLRSRVRGSRALGGATVGAAWIGMLAASALSLACPAVGSAATGHEFLARLSEAPPGRALREPGAVAVDHVTGEVFVADPGTGVVDVFTAAGTYVTRFGAGLEATALAVDEASGDVYVAEPVEDAVLVFKPNGTGGYEQLSRWSGAKTPEGAFGEVAGVAVDNSTSGADPSAGDVYVVDAEPLQEKLEKGAVYVFKPKPAGPEESQEGELVGSLTKKLEAPNGVAVSAVTGRVYVADAAKGAVYAYSSAGIYEATLTGSGSPLGPFGGKSHEGVREEEGDVTSLAIDETTGDLLVASGERDLLDEFNAAGEWVGWVTGTPSGPFGAVQGVAVGASGDVYIADSEQEQHVVDVFGPGVLLPDVTTKAPAKVTGTTATLKGAIDGDGKPASYHFEVGETDAYGSLSTPVSETSGGAEEQVEAAVTGLKPDTKYYVRLVAQNENGTDCGAGLAFTTEGGESTGGHAESQACQLPGAAIEGESAVQVGASKARLQARINPRGHETTYQFEYGSQECSSNPGACTLLPASPPHIGAGESGVVVSLQLEGLAPDTTYHYRVLATNGLGTSEGIEGIFTTQSSGSSFALPDHRAWEMVTPPDKHGAPVEALTREGGQILASEDGDALTYVAKGAITEQPEGNRSLEMQQALATRSSSGWATQDIATPQTRGLGANVGVAPEYQFFSADLALALVQPPYGPSEESEPPLAPNVTQATVYVRDDRPIEPQGEAETQLFTQAQREGNSMKPTNAGYLPLVTEANVALGTAFGTQLQFFDATPDLSHVVLSSQVALPSPERPGETVGPGLYEWSAGKLRFVSMLPDGMPATAAALGYYHVQARAVSSDGARVIWTNGVAGHPHLYVRDTATGRTVMLDSVQGLSEQEQPAGEAEFQTASTDGSRVFFTDDQKLVSGSSAEEAKDADLYVYECESGEEPGGSACALEDLTAGVRHAGEHAAVQTLVLGASEDGATIYLIARGVLATNEAGDGETARPGEYNLYELHHEGTGPSGEWTTSFIASLSQADSVGWEGGAGVEGSEGSAGLDDMSYLTARVSSNGRYLAFMSDRPFTGYDNEDVSSEHLGKRLDEEVFLYDSQTASLTCVSCDPTGARPVGVLDEQHAREGFGLLVDRREVWGRGHVHWLAGSIPGWTAQSNVSALAQSRYLSNEGRLFFDSADALVPQVETPLREEEVEGKMQAVGVENVYEYEPPGVGSCQGATGGCVALISSGASENESAFLEATPSGNDVFFITSAPLLPQDTDDAFDIYDARVCSEASPCLTPPPPAPSGCEETEACRPVSPPVQAPGGPSGTESFSGSGNLHPAQQGVKGAKEGIKPPPTRAQKFAKALAVCRKEHARSKRKRQACEAHARHLYGPGKKPKSGAKAKRSSRGGGR